MRQKIERDKQIRLGKADDKEKSRKENSKFRENSAMLQTLNKQIQEEEDDLENLNDPVIYVVNARGQRVPILLNIRQSLRDLRKLNALPTQVTEAMNDLEKQEVENRNR